MSVMAVTNASLDAFPEYIDPIEPFDMMASASPVPLSKTVASIRDQEEHSRRPSPQPSHLSLPYALRKQTLGYVAPTFAEKPVQKLQGMNSDITKVIRTRI